MQVLSVVFLTQLEAGEGDNTIKKQDEDKVANKAVRFPHHAPCSVRYRRRCEVHRLHCLKVLHPPELDEQTAQLAPHSLSRVGSSLREGMVVTLSESKYGAMTTKRIPVYRYDDATTIPVIVDIDSR